MLFLDLDTDPDSIESFCNAINERITSDEKTTNNNSSFATVEANSAKSIDINYSTNVENLQQDSEGDWYLSLEGAQKNRIVRSKFVFLGAGGGALSLLQKSGIPEGLSYAGFPVSGKWLICDEEKSTKTHNAKVYGNAAVGAPPMSVPHLSLIHIRRCRRRG